jgi:uncharacterized OsmC-like protein
VKMPPPSLPSRKGQSGRLLRRPQRDHHAATVADFCTAVSKRVIPMLKFELRGIEVSLHGVRQDSPPKMLRIAYEIVVDTDESDARLDLLHRNLRKYGTIYNTLADATELSGTIRRRD